MNIISVIISILMLYALYYIFEHYDFKTAVIINCVYGIITSIMNNGFRILAIFLGIGVTIIETYIAYQIYKRSNSFWGFLGGMILVVIAIAAVIAIIAFIISSSFSGGIVKH